MRFRRRSPDGMVIRGRSSSGRCSDTRDTLPARTLLSFYPEGIILGKTYNSTVPGVYQERLLQGHRRHSRIH